ncbi:MAG: hypothetical protein HY543_08455 [Deltaproteobacteria bacterium]|nr:hypothetical protein [Deltaproteobacteria bacterium]
MTVKNYRVGQTYGDRRQLTKEHETANQQNPIARFLNKLNKIGDFFSTDPKVAAGTFSPNAQFLDGANVNPEQYFRRLTESRSRGPGLSQAEYLAQIDTILAPKKNPAKSG